MKSKIISVMLVELLGITSKQEEDKDNVLAEIENLASETYEKYEGFPVKTEKNILAVVFESPTAATFAALELLKRHKEVKASRETPESVALRIAINTGETALAHDDVYGDVLKLTHQVLRHTKEGKIVFTESTFLAMTRNRVATSVVSTESFPGIPYPVTLLEVVDAEVDQASPRRRSYSFFGLIPADVDGNLRKSYPAKFSSRVLAGLIDGWLGICFALLFPVLSSLPQIYGVLFDIYRVQAEDFELTGPTTRSKNSWTMGKSYIFFDGADQAQHTFERSSGTYDVILAYQLFDSKAKMPHLDISVGTLTYALEPVFGGDYFKVRRIGKNVQINKGDTIRFKKLLQYPKSEIDYVEFIPSESKAFRPKGVERSYRFIDLWRAIGYDDMNVHFSLLPLPFYTFLHMFLVQVLFGRTFGGMFLGLHCRDVETKQPVGLWAAFIRTSTWFLFPFMAWTAPLKPRLWTDISSGSEVVVYVKTEMTKSVE